MDSFRKHLDNAKGFSEFVIALNLDIRGFSDWSLKVDSAQTALFMKKVYAKLIDRFFTDAAFVKPTGDGLFVIIDFKEDELSDVVTKTVDDAMTMVEGFGTLCDDDAIVNFEVPADIGIGISRGAASRLASGNTTLDYSGRVLNLASRLMDLARPRGIVFDAGLGAQLLPLDLKAKFREREVYLKGVAPRAPVEVFCWPDSVEIPRLNRFPIGEPRWEHRQHHATWRSLAQDMGEDDEFVMVLEEHPPDPSTLVCIVSHDSVTPGGRRSKGFTSENEIPVRYVDAAGEAQAIFSKKKLIDRLQKMGVGPTWPVEIKVSYRVS